MTIQDTVQQFILDDVLAGERGELDPQEPLYGSGLLDSLGTLRLITFIEDQFGVVVGDGEVGSENFGTVACIASFVEKKQAAS
jgi:acyl carrier protein